MTVHATYEAGSAETPCPPSRPISGWRDWAAVAVMSSSGTLLSMIFVVVAPIQIALSAHFGGDAGADALAQWVMGMPGFGMAAGGVLAGFIGTRLGLRATATAGLGLYGLMGAAGLVVDDSWSLLGSRFMLGAAGVVFATAATTLIGERFEGAARARVLGCQNAVAAGGGLLAIYLSAVLAGAYGWRSSFALFLVAFAPLLLGLVAIPRQPPRLRTKAATDGSLLPLLPLYALVTGIMAATFIGSIQEPFILKQDGLASEASIGTLVAVSSLAFGVGGLAYGWVRPRFGARAVMALGLMAMGAGAMIAGLLHGLVAADGGVLALGIGGGMLTPNLINILIDRTSQTQRDRAIGLFFTASFVGTPLNTVVMPLLTAAIGLRGGVVFAGVLLLAGAAYAALRRPVAKRSARSSMAGHDRR